MSDRPTILVAAGVIVREHKVLLSQRKADSHLAGTWEFPGGKVEADEDPRAALKRELEEELGVWAHVGDALDVTFHRYETKSVLLLFFHATLLPDSPEPRARRRRASLGLASRARRADVSARRRRDRQEGAQAPLTRVTA